MHLFDMKNFPIKTNQITKNIIYLYPNQKGCEMKLIAESGSTRTEWALVEDNHLVQRVFTEGLNPFFQTRREISRSVRLGLPESFFKKNWIKYITMVPDAVHMKRKIS